MPSTRSLVAELKVSPATVQRALDRLVAAAVLVTRPGAGTFVAARRPAAGADTAWQEVSLGPSLVDASVIAGALRDDAPGTLQMGAGYVDAALRPDGRLAQALARAARRPGVWNPPPVRGVAELRAWFAAQIGAGAEDVLITPAAQGALSAVIRAVAAAGETILISMPCYPGALAVARSAGLVPVAVPTDADGVRPELVERAFAQTGARLLYLQPTFANPDGSVLAPARRAEVIEVAHRAGAVIIEDDWARWLGHGGRVPPPLLADDRDGHVVTVCSLTKVAAPSLRVGAVIARGPVGARIADMRLVDDFFVSGPLQQAAVEFVSSPGWRSHLKELSTALYGRRAELSRNLRAQLPGCQFGEPRGGVSLWLRLPPGVSDLDVASEAFARGLQVLPGRHYLLSAQPESYLRLSFAGLPQERIAEGVRRLAEAIAAAAPAS